MDIIRAKKMGFCFGVEKAVKTCYQVAKEQNENIYILGMVVHNKDVVKEMKGIGFKIIEEESILKNEDTLSEKDTVIIRAHGTTEEVLEKLKEKKVKIVDATCVFVKKIKEILIEQENKDEEILFVGDKNHPEVKGIISFGRKVTVFKNIDELKKFDFNEKIRYSLLTQTTLNKEKFNEIRNYLEKTHRNVTIFDRICGATSERQEAAKELAKNTDVVFIVGDEKSSNSKKLLEISLTYNENSYLIQNDEELDLSLIENAEKIGITAGASTPENIIKKIENKIRGNRNV